MYSKFYGLSHKPFELSPDPDLVFLSETHQEALAVLLYGVYNRKGFLQISGKVGTGKSTLVQSLIRKLENNVLVCHIPNPNFTVAEFYYYISAKFGLEPFDGNRAKFILNLAEFLKQCREKGEFALLIIDEAQVLSLELLEEIRLLSNQEYTEFGVLSIFFVGQPELNVLLKHKKMEPLRNRIGIRFNLEPLTLDETVAYIQFRLRKAGRTARLFSAKALQKIHEASGGIPRSINILCDNALLTGFAEHLGVIDENIIINCIKEIEQPDVNTVPPEGAQISSRMQPEPLSPNPALQQAGKEVNRDKTGIMPNTLPRKLAFILVITCGLFFAMIYTTEFWGRLPGTESAKAWFEKFHGNEFIQKKLKELFGSQKSGTRLNTADKKMLSEKVIAFPGQGKESITVQNKNVIGTKSLPGPGKENTPSNDIGTATSGTKQKSDGVNQTASNRLEADQTVISPGVIAAADGQSEIKKKPEKRINQSTASQIVVEQTETKDGVIAAAPKQLEIKREPDGTKYISVTRQIEPVPGGRNLPDAEAITQPVNTTQKADEFRYVSITGKVGGANIRSGPSMDDSIIRAVIPGYPFRVVGRYMDWYLVEDFKKRRGWVASFLIDKISTVILTSGTVNLLSGPNYRNDIVASMDYGTVLLVQEKQGPWMKVYKGDGIAGWIHKDKVWP